MKRRTKLTAALLALTLTSFALLGGCTAVPEETITKVSDLAGQTVASYTGTIFGQQLDTVVDGVKHLYLNDLPAQLKSVESGKAVATLMDEPTARLALAEWPGLMMLDEKLAEDCYGFAFKKGDPLTEQVSAIIRQFQEDGTMDAIGEKWFSADESIKTMPELTHKAEFDGSAGTLHFGHDTVTVPMSYMGDDGKARGYDVELAMRIAYELNMNIELTGMEFSSLLVSLAAGKSDMVGGCMSITEERKKSVDFTEPYYIGGMVVVIKRTQIATDEITKISQLNGKRVGILTGSIYMEALEKAVQGTEVRYFNNVADQVEALRAGKLDAFVMDGATVTEAIRSAPELTTLEEDLGATEFGMVFALGNTALQTKVNGIIGEMKADGTLAAVREKWFGSDETAKVLPEPTHPATNGVFRVATNSTLPPHTYIKDGEIVGCETEIALHIADTMGMSLEISDMDFAAILPAVTTGKADMGMGQICITEERKKSVLFSDGTDADTIEVVVRGTKRTPLETARVGVVTGSTGELIIAKDYPGATISSFDTYPDAVAALSGRKLDYAIGSYTSMLNYAKNNPRLTVLGDKMNNDTNSIAIKKGNLELRDKIDAVLTQFRADGTLAEIETRWIKVDTTPYVEVELPKRETGEVLRVAISADREPICFVMDGRYVGFDCELIERIAYEMNMQVEYQNMKFGGLIAALQSGKADVAISNLTQTAERAESVEFTQDYFDNPQILLTTTDTTVAAVPWYTALAQSFEKTFITENRWKLVLDGLGITLVISVLSSIVGTVLGFVVCLMRRSKTKWLRAPATFFVGVIQGLPIVVILMLIFFCVFSGIDAPPVLVAVMAFSINFAAYVSEMMRTGINAVDKGQLEAASAIGFNKVQVFIKITLPQAARHVLPVYKGELISMVKMTSVVGYIAIQDLTKMSDIIRSRTYDAFFPLVSIALIYLALSYIVAFLLSRVEFRVDPKHRKRIVKGVVDQ